MTESALGAQRKAAESCMQLCTCKASGRLVGGSEGGGRICSRVFLRFLIVGPSLLSRDARKVIFRTPTV